MLMLVSNDSTSSLGNTISGAIQNAAPIMREQISLSSRTQNLLLVNLRAKNPNVKSEEFPGVLSS